MNADSLPSSEKTSTHLARAAAAGLSLAVVLALAIVATPGAQAQTYNVIHTFTGGLDGGGPSAGLTMDAAGNFYGTTCGMRCAAGASNAGTVFRLSKKGSGWVFTPLYVFRGGGDGADPVARVIIGPDGSFYGTTNSGAGDCRFGTVFNLKPAASGVSPNILGGWTETVIYRFPGWAGGESPGLGDLIFDQAGNIYGTTEGRSGSAGTIFQLAPSVNGWAGTVLYSFTNGADGAFPVGGVIFDDAGNLYGTASQGGDPACDQGGCGTVFQLEPSGSYLNVLYTFHTLAGGAFPFGGLISDQLGNLYGSTSGFYSQSGGTVFQLIYSYSGWSLKTLYSFAGPIGPLGSLTMDAAGNLYGTTYEDGLYYAGTVFKLTHSGYGWTYTSLHDFSGGSDGGWPIGQLAFDGNGNLYGTASQGGPGACSGGCGVVWEITP